MQFFFCFDFLYFLLFIFLLLSVFIFFTFLSYFIFFLFLFLPLSFCLFYFFIYAVGIVWSWNMISLCVKGLGYTSCAETFLYFIARKSGYYAECLSPTNNTAFFHYDFIGLLLHCTEVTFLFKVHIIMAVESTWLAQKEMLSLSYSENFLVTGFWCI